ncbi:MAG: hypothetical protein IKO56_04595, partial [Alphaproteobacteria bacterium]|nr:hypothetical protein [Alphaproteobacteria bacterium]
MIGQTTTYAYKLKYLENPTFDKVKDLVKNFIEEMPNALVDDLYNAINRDIDILKTEPEMLVYLNSFGNMNQAKLNFAFDKIPEEFFKQPEINIIDYGCGQAIGTMCYADFLKSKNCNQKIKSVTLIEPSEICIKRAALHTSIFLPDANIVTVNKSFDELFKNDINCEEYVPTLHILSNVLDLLNFNFDRFMDLIRSRLFGLNQFVCVGSLSEMLEKKHRFGDFAEYLGENITLCKVFRNGQFIKGYNWTCQALVFSIDLWSTKISKEDREFIKLSEEFTSDDATSKNGKKLLYCRNMKSYTIKTGMVLIGDYAFSGCSHLQNIS